MPARDFISSGADFLCNLVRENAKPRREPSEVRRAFAQIGSLLGAVASSVLGQLLANRIALYLTALQA
jgi:hypothetical protein